MADEGSLQIIRVDREDDNRTRVWFRDGQHKPFDHLFLKWVGGSALGKYLDWAIETHPYRSKVHGGKGMVLGRIAKKNEVQNGRHV